LLFGILLGDGCLCCYYPKDRKQRKVIAITGNFYDDRNFFEIIIVPLLGSLTNNSIKIKDKQYTGTIEIHIFDIILFNKIESLNFPVGKKGTNLFIPKVFYKKNLIKYIVQGFMATDGSLVLTKNPNKFYPRIEAVGISPNLIKQITNYLNSIGMKGQFYMAKRNKIDMGNKWGLRQQAYRFQFNGMRNLLLFNELISFVNPKHKKKFDKFIEYSREYDDLMFGIPTKQQKILRTKFKNFSFQ